MIYECNNNHISFSKDHLIYCGMRGCGRAAKVISQTDIEWFYQISPAGLAIERKDLRKILQDKNIPIESKRKVKAVFAELSDYEFSLEDHLIRTTPSMRSPMKTNPNFRMPIVVYGEYDGMNEGEEKEGVAKLQDQEFFILKYTPPPDACHKLAKIRFHNVTIIIPDGLFLPVPSAGRFIDPIFEFEDGTREETSASEQHIDGPTRFQGVFTNNNPVTTVLSHHLHPQAGVTVWRNSGMIKLLVSKDQ